MKNTTVLDLVHAFAVTALVVGIIITIFAKEYSTAGDVGKIIVIVSFCVTAVCQIIKWIRRKTKKA